MVAAPFPVWPRRMALAHTHLRETPTDAAGAYRRCLSAPGHRGRLGRLRRWQVLADFGLLNGVLELIPLGRVRRRRRLAGVYERLLPGEDLLRAQDGRVDVPDGQDPFVDDDMGLGSP